MQKILNINQVKTMISKHLNKKIINDMLELGLHYKFYYNNDGILYAKINLKYISFYNFLDDIDIYCYLYEYIQNKYFIINIHPEYNVVYISLNGEKLNINIFENFFNDFNPNIMNYINSIKLLYKL